MPELHFPVAPAIRAALSFQERLDVSLNVFGPTQRFRRLARSQGWATPRDLVVAGPEAVADIVWRRRGTPADTAEIRHRLQAWLGCSWEEARVALGLPPPVPADPRLAEVPNAVVDPALLAAPLFTLPVGRAVIRLAATLGWTTVGELVAVPPEGFQKLHRIGPARRRHVESVLRGHLKMSWSQARRQMQLAQGPVRSRPPASRETAGPLQHGRPAGASPGNEEEREGR
jgi:hypothetical protein